MAEKNTSEDLSINREGLEYWEDTPKPDMPKDKKAKKKSRNSDKSISLLEKYQPEEMSEIVGQIHLQEILNDLVAKKNISHMIFIGPPGVGKTSVAKILARKHLGPNWKNNFIEVNVPNDNNDLKFINSDLKNSIRIKPTGAPFRIVFLDECEDLNREAQSALRKILEANEYRYARFIFATNYSEKLMTQLQGERIRVLHFKKIPNDIIEAYLDKICDDEGITYEGDALKLIVENTNGSLRNGIDNIDFLRDVNNHISLQKVKNSIAYLKPSVVKELLLRAINDKGYNSYLDELVSNQGLSIPKLLQEVFKVIDEIKLENSKDKKYIINQLGLYSWRINQGSDQMLQMRCFLNSIASMHDI